jgi:Protein of unknown function (DUF2971)
MILDRVYAPSDDDVIYHYCSPDTFLKIVASQSMWATASSALNDTTERKWGYSIFDKAVEQLAAKVPKSFFDQVRAMIDIAYQTSQVMVSCYSLEGDMLGQWLSYAEDGRGFAIGFSAKQMTLLPAKSLRVLYDEKEQIAELVGNLTHIFKFEESIGFRYDQEFQRHCFMLGGDLCAYKNPAFSAEREIRIAHMSGLAPAGKSKKMVPLGARGPGGKRLFRPQKIHFRMNKGVIVPYVVLDYSNLSVSGPVKEIVLGPKNENDVQNVEMFLNTTGLPNIAVRRSNVPYR